MVKITGDDGEAHFPNAKYDLSGSLEPVLAKMIHGIGEESPDDARRGEVMFQETDRDGFERDDKECRNCTEIDDVAELVGEISEALTSPDPSCSLNGLDKIAPCLRSCLSAANKCLWLTLMSSVRGGRKPKGEEKCVESSSCKTEVVLSPLFGHLRSHLAATELPASSHLRIRSAPSASSAGARRLVFKSPDFALCFVEDVRSPRCHECDVAATLLYCLERLVFDDDRDGRKQDDQEDIYSDNSIPTRNDRCSTDGDESRGAKLTADPRTTEKKDDSFERTIANEVERNDDVFGVISTYVSRPKNEGAPFHSVAGQDPPMLYSEFSPVRAGHSSSGSQPDAYETMPPDSAHFRKAEENRRSKVVYGSTDEMLQFVRNDVRAWRGSSDGSRTVGVVLSKYKNVIKTKSKSYDEDVHYIRVTSSPLGSGCSGKCYMAVDNSSRAAFCLKILKCLNVSEIEVWSRLSDVEGVPKLYGLLFHDDRVSILQEFIHGPTLKSLIDQSVLSLSDSLSKLKQLLLTLCELHQRNIVHNDVKADNIIDGKRQVLLDFGLSVRSEKGVGPGVEPCGSQCHWSPEKAASEGHGTKSDVWAATVVFVHMLTGVEPWKNRFKNSRALHLIVKKNSPPWEDVPDDLPEEVVDLIRQGWMVDANSRASAIQLLNHRAFELIETTSIPGESLNRIKFNDGRLEDAIDKQLRESEILLLELQKKKLVKDSPSTSAHPSQGAGSEIINDDNRRGLDGNDSKTNSLTREAVDILSHLPTNCKLGLSREVLEELQTCLDEDFIGISNKTGERSDFSSRIPSLKCHDVLAIHNPTVAHETVDASKPVPHLNIPIMVEQQSLSSSDEDGACDDDERRHAKRARGIADQAGILVKIMLDDDTIHSCRLLPGSDTKWSEVATWSSREVHRRSVNSFYLALHPTGEKINASEKVMATLSRQRFSRNATNSFAEQIRRLEERSSSSRICGRATEVVWARVVEIQNDVQRWDWKVENGVLSPAYKWKT